MREAANRQKKLVAHRRASSYFAKTALRPAFKIFFFFILILEAARFKLEFDVALHQPHPFAALFTAVALWLPLYTFIGIQLSVFVGLMLGIASMAKSRELDSFHALGLGLHNLLAPIVKTVCVVGVVALLVLGWAQPLAVYATKTFAHSLQATTNVLLDGGDIFFRDGNRTVFIERVSNKGKSFERMFSYEIFDDGKTVTITGLDGTLNFGAGYSSWNYTAKHATVLELRPDTKSDLGGVAKNQTLTQLNATTGNFAREKNQQFRERGTTEYEWTLGELIFASAQNLPKIERHRISTEISYRLAEVAFILILPFLAAIVVIEPRRNPGPLRQGLAALFVLAFQQYLSIGANFSRNNIQPPSLTLWLPVLIVAALVLWRFWRLSFGAGFRGAR